MRNEKIFIGEMGSAKRFFRAEVVQRSCRRWTKSKGSTPSRSRSETTTAWQWRPKLCLDDHSGYKAPLRPSVTRKASINHSAVHSDPMSRSDTAPRSRSPSPLPKVLCMYIYTYKYITLASELSFWMRPGKAQGTQKRQI